MNGALLLLLTTAVPGAAPVLPAEPEVAPPPTRMGAPLPGNPTLADGGDVGGPPTCGPGGHGCCHRLRGLFHPPHHCCCGGPGTWPAPGYAPVPVSAVPAIIPPSAPPAPASTFWGGTTSRLIPAGQPCLK
jgi:hypothetical protein